MRAMQLFGMMLGVLLLTACSAPKDANKQVDESRNLELEAATSLHLSSEKVSLGDGVGAHFVRVTQGRHGSILVSWTEAVGEGNHALRWMRIAQDGVVGPTRLAAQGSNWFVNWADVPLVMESGEVLWAAWLVRIDGASDGYGIRVAHSADGGSTWSAPSWLHDDTSAVEHGFVSMVPHGEGGALAVWLDGRAFSEKREETQLISRVLNGDGSAMPEVVVDARTCDCCPTALLDMGDKVIAAWRDRTDEEVRDIWMAETRKGTWTVPSGMHADNWKVAGCPVNGPVLAAREGTVFGAWYSEGAGTPQVLAGLVGGAGISEPVVIGEGTVVGRPAIAPIGEDSVLVGWLERVVNDALADGETASSGRFMVRLMDKQARLGAPFEVGRMDSSRASGIPRLVANGDAVLAVWTDVQGQTIGAARITGRTAEQQALADAKAIAQELGGALKQSLVAKMKEGGPVAAVEHCSLEAESLTAKVSAERGAKIGRSSLRLRNPNNTAPDWVAAWLNEQGQRKIEGVQGVAIIEQTASGEVARFLKPLGVEAPCLNCHGPEPAAPIAKVLEERYPNDQATGYALGDLRGALWVELPVQPSPP